MCPGVVRVHGAHNTHEGVASSLPEEISRAQVFFFSPQQDGFRLINWYENTKRDYEATVDRFGSFLFLGCA